ncbi:MAG: gephyrin-like molybdotransferase Glp [Pseudomonadota bacterium]
MTEKISSAPSCADPFDPDAISLSDALQRIEARVRSVQACERLPIRECLQRINNEPVLSPHNIPPLSNSAMDGYAIAIASLTESSITEFEEIGTAYAGQPFNGNCSAGQCVRIMTGALIPQGTDAVIMQEQAETAENGKIRIDGNHRVGENIRQAGEDIAKGANIIDAGVRLGPADLGVLASLGMGHLQVKRKPTVAFFSTGDELISIGETLTPGKIYDSNRYSLHGLLSRHAVDIIDLGVIPDRPEALRELLEKVSIQADLVISTGGVSVGEADYIESVLEEMGEIDFNKVAIKPGRPLTMAQINDTIFMGLPGNPVAVMVTFSQFVVPVIDLLCGAQAYSPATFNARSTEKMRKRAGRHEFQRGIASLDENGQWQVCKTGKQGSGILTSMSRANCFIVLDSDCDGVEPGDNVKIQLFDWAW